MNSVLENIRDGFYKLDLQGNIVDFNSSLARILGYAAEDLKGLNYRELTSDYYAFYTALNFSTVFREKRSIDNLHWKLTRGDGKEIYVSSSISPVFDDNGEVIFFQGILRDTSDVLAKVYQDAMTGLYNYRYLRERMKQDFTSIFEGRTTAEKNAAVLFLDGNNLKKINDIFGHDCGDEIIKKVAEILKDTVRKTDTAARLGGDEFIIYLPDIDGGVEKVIKRIIKEVDEIPYGLSIGCRIINFALETAENTDVEQIVEGVIKDADDAMYNIKENSSFKQIMLNNCKLEIKNSGYKIVGKKEVYVDNKDVQGFLF
jgi:diguanylate cyclase (GGDEF)-like protein/PAS domain S-box-containing protein